jgi:hypothetical protein
MTLSADAIINGLTMLRAYGCIQSVQCSGANEPSHDTCGTFVVKVNKHPGGMHPEDVQRMESEGWWWIESAGQWELV